MFAKLILKSLSVLSKTENTLYEHRSEKDLTKLVALVKATIKSCADTAVFLVKATMDILTYRREKIKPELNQNYRHISVEKSEHPKHLFGDDLPKILKDMAETNKVGTPPIKQHHQISKLFFIKKPGVPSKRSSPPATSLPVAKKSKIWQPSTQKEHDYAAKTISLKEFDKEASSIISKCTSLNESNKAGAISECLEEWKKITSDKWVLETVKGIKIDVHNVKNVH